MARRYLTAFEHWLSRTKRLDSLMSPSSFNARRHSMSEPQRTMFDLAAPEWERDDAAEQLVATVVFASGPEKPFDYLIPETLEAEVEPGRRLRVPFGRGDRSAVGYCIETGLKPAGQHRLKMVDNVVDASPLLSSEMLRLTRWIAEHYLCPLGRVLETVVPAGVRAQAGSRRILHLSVTSEIAAGFRQLKLPPKQARIVEYLVELGAAAPLQQVLVAVKTSPATIAALRKKGLVESEYRRAPLAQIVDPQLDRDQPLALNDDQQLALGAIEAALHAQRHATLLIHGVTGSGKTEVYMQAIREVLRFGRQAIVLVPEISLTPQAQQRFVSRFGRVAVLHSHMSDVERHRHWEMIARGEVGVVVGARSAIFAPTPRLGLIILDEEHESSFKQAESPRYHARDVALERARAEEIPLVLGSATPSLESWRRCESGEFQLVDMPRRIQNRPLPGVGIVDLRLEFQDRRNRGAISRVLVQAMQMALNDGGQVILLLNRRGYSTHIQCAACGDVVRCPDCSIALTHHVREQSAICHYCEHEQPAPATCPKCGFVGIHYGGLGTQKLEAEVRARFPNFPCLRMDTDTMQKPGSHERALAAFHRGEVRILLGTQMIAKGLDFPNVTLVGVVNADTALHLPDFRAAERTFQLVTQVAGRTGRGERGGRVLVQTFSPEHPAIVAAATHDFLRFARQELPMRQALNYPPFAEMVRIVARGESEAVTREFAEQIAAALRKAAEQCGLVGRVLGPAPAPIAKLRGKHRFQLQLQAVDGQRLRDVVRDVVAGLPPSDAVEWMVDVDPLDML